MLMLAAMLATATAFTSQASTSETAPAPPPLVFHAITFRERVGARRTVAAEEAYLTVPASHAHPGDGRTMQLHLIRFRSTAVHPGAPIVYLAGGPGGSGSVAAGGARFEWFMALREAGDVIALDQRGTYSSRPYTVCPGAWSYPLDVPLIRDSLAAVMRRFAGACVAHWSADGIDLADFNTEESADDIESLRVALGVPKISLVGISYGTHLGLSVLRRHPASVARAVLAGVEGPDQTLKLPSDLDRAMYRVDSLMKADPALAGAPGLVSTFDAALRRLRTAPMSVTIGDGAGDSATVTIGPADLRLALAENLGERRTIQRLPAALAGLAKGDYTSVARASYQRRTNQRELGMAIATDCASGASTGRLARIAREAPASTLGDVINYPYPDLCDAWPHRDLGDAFRSAVRSDVPTLFVSGTLDARTPPTNAAEVAAGFTNARELLIENGGHDDDLLIASPAIGDAMVAFLRGGEPASLHVTLPPLKFGR